MQIGMRCDPELFTGRALRFGNPSLSSLGNSCRLWERMDPMAWGTEKNLVTPKLLPWVSSCCLLPVPVFSCCMLRRPDLCSASKGRPGPRLLTGLSIAELPTRDQREERKGVGVECPWGRPLLFHSRLLYLFSPPYVPLAALCPPTQPLRDANQAL